LGGVEVVPGVFAPGASGDDVLGDFDAAADDVHERGGEADGGGPEPVAGLARGGAASLEELDGGDDDAADEDPEFDGRARLHVEPGRGVVEVGLGLLVVFDPGVRGVPSEPVLAPGGLFAGEVEGGEGPEEDPPAEPLAGEAAALGAGPDAGGDAGDEDEDGGVLEEAGLLGDPPFDGLGPEGAGGEEGEHEEGGEGDGEPEGDVAEPG